MSVIRPIFNSKANNKNRDFPYNFVGYKASEFGYKGNVGYKAKISENLVCGLISDVDCTEMPGYKNSRLYHFLAYNHFIREAKF